MVVALIETLDRLRTETRRRDLPGPVGPTDDVIAAIVDEFHRSDPSPIDVRLVDATLLATGPSGGLASVR